MAPPSPLDAARYNLVDPLLPPAVKPTLQILKGCLMRFLQLLHLLIRLFARRLLQRQRLLFGPLAITGAERFFLLDDLSPFRLASLLGRAYKKTGRRISFEYAMIDGVNDSDYQADLIAKKIRGMPGHVNLIPLNDVVESPLKPSRRIAAFQKRLESHGITATVRRSLGGDIDASCGQLRRKAMEEEHQQ